MCVKVLIPFYKEKQKLEKCLGALKGQVNKEDIIIRDDTETKCGFVHNCNELIYDALETQPIYLIILNQDCYLEAGAITAMVDFMNEHPRCAIGGIKQFATEGGDDIIHGGCTAAFPNGQHIGGKKSAGDCKENAKMPWVNGACMIVRVAALIDFGVMDKNYTHICSDSDWCYSARDRGWEVWYIADATCVHEQNISRKPDDDNQKRQMHSDVIRFRDKWITDGVYRELSMEIF